MASFFEEARSIAKLSHPNVVQVHDTGNEEGVSYIVMELVDGRTMRDFIRESFTPTTELAVMMMRQAALGVNAAHDMGIIHRDIKPANILVGNDWEVKVADFGLATPVGDHASNQLVVGTPAYMSPEQCRGEGVSQSSDIYSLGATFYHFLSGRLPFEDEDTLELMRKHVYAKLRPLREINPDISFPLARLIERMMAKETKHRCRSLVEAVQDLDRVHRTAAIEQAKIRVGGGRSTSVTTAPAPAPEDDIAQVTPTKVTKPLTPVMKAPRRRLRTQLVVALLLLLTGMVIGKIAGSRLTWGGPDSAALSALVESRCKRRDYEEARRLLTRRIQESSKDKDWLRAELARVMGEAKNKVQDEIINVRNLEEKGDIPAALIALDLLEHRFKGAGVDVRLLRKKLESARESRRAAWTEADLASTLARARLLKQNKQTTEAIYQYEDVVAATCRFAQRPEIREATQELAQLKRRDREARDFYLSGLALDRTLQTKTAMDMLQRAIKRLPGSVWAQLADDLNEIVSDRYFKAKVLYLGAEKFVDGKNHRQAIDQFDRIATEYPDTSFASRARERLQDL